MEDNTDDLTVSSIGNEFDEILDLAVKKDQTAREYQKQAENLQKELTRLQLWQGSASFQTLEMRGSAPFDRSLPNRFSTTASGRLGSSSFRDGDNPSFYQGSFPSSIENRSFQPGIQQFPSEGSELIADYERKKDADALREAQRRVRVLERALDVRTIRGGTDNKQLVKELAELRELTTELEDQLRTTNQAKRESSQEVLEYKKLLANQASSREGKNDKDIEELTQTIQKLQQEKGVLLEYVESAAETIQDLKQEVDTHKSLPSNPYSQASPGLPQEIWSQEQPLSQSGNVQNSVMPDQFQQNFKSSDFAGNSDTKNSGTGNSTRNVFPDGKSVEKLTAEQNGEPLENALLKLRQTMTEQQQRLGRPNVPSRRYPTDSSVVQLPSQSAQSMRERPAEQVYDHLMGIESSPSVCSSKILPRDQRFSPAAFLQGVEDDEGTIDSGNMTAHTFQAAPIDQRAQVSPKSQALVNKSFEAVLEANKRLELLQTQMAEVQSVYQNEKAELEDKLNLFGKQLEAMQSINDTQKIELSESRLENATMKGRNLELEGQLQLTKQIEQGKIATQSEELASIKEENIEMKIHISELQEQLQTLKLLEKENGKAKNKISAYEQERTEILSENVDLQESLRQLMEQVEGSKNQETVELEMSQLRARNEVLKQQLNQSNSKIDEMEKQTQQETAELKKVNAECTSRAARLFLENTILKEKLSSAEARADVLEETASLSLKAPGKGQDQESSRLIMLENGKLKRQIKELEASILQNQESKSAALEASIDKLQEENEELKRHCIDLAAQLAFAPLAPTTQSKPCQTEVEGACDFIPRGNLDSLEEELFHLQSRWDEVSPRLAALDALVEQLETLGDFEADQDRAEENDIPVSRRHTLWVSLPYLEQISSLLYARITDIHTSLIRQENKVDDLKTVIKDLQQKNERQNEQILHLDEQLDQLHSENARINYDLMYQEEAKNKLIRESLKAASLPQEEPEDSREVLEQMQLVQQSVEFAEQQQALSIRLQAQLEVVDAEMKILKEQNNQLKAAGARAWSRLRQGLLKALPAVQALQRQSGVARSSELEWAVRPPLGTTEIEGNEIVEITTLCLKTLAEEVLQRISPESTQQSFYQERSIVATSPTRYITRVEAPSSHSFKNNISLSSQARAMPTPVHSDSSFEAFQKPPPEDQQLLRGWTSGDEHLSSGRGHYSNAKATYTPKDGSRSPLYMPKTSLNTPSRTPAFVNTSNSKSLLQVANQLKQVQHSISRLREPQI